jgi:hypothetical protein
MDSGTLAFRERPGMTAALPLDVTPPSVAISAGAKKQETRKGNAS